jgi:hypothetical protein
MKIRAWFSKAAAKLAAWKLWIFGATVLFVIGLLKYVSDVESVEEAVQGILDYLKLVGALAIAAVSAHLINKCFGRARLVAKTKEMMVRFFKKQIISLYEHIVPDYREKPETLFWGLLVYHIQYYIGDVIVYGLVIWYFTGKFGAVLGTAIGCCVMIPITIIANVLWIWFYDKKKKDYIGIEAIKKDRFQTFAGEAVAGRFYRWIYRSRSRAFIWLTLRSDPTIATVFLRGESYQFNGLGMKGFLLLSASTILANVVWAARWGIVIFAGRLVLWLWQNPGLILDLLERMKLDMFFFA